MLTARAEYRLRLRADNAEVRLTPKAIAAGCVSQKRRGRYERLQGERSDIERLLGRMLSAAQLNQAGVPVRDDGARRSLSEWIRFPEVDKTALLAIEPGLYGFDGASLEAVIEDCRYAPYVARQQSEIDRLRAEEGIRIPPELRYCSIAGLSNEMIERLTIARPTSLGAAGRIRGITPAALAAILVHARRKAA
jgi:tRNA uridine 5-carboxymethylaminomethyl modification enzyme